MASAVGGRCKFMMDPGSSEGRKQKSAGLEYEVFLSFRGEDTRKGFTGHLYKSLFEDGISVFIDSEDLKKGERIDELFRYIERSEIFVPIFSENYARSKWCLMEAAKITEVARIPEEKRHVIPVFLKVEPSDVINQRGTFHSAFRDHKNKRGIKPEELKRWRDALKWIAGISGHNLGETNGHEPTLVERVRDRVRELLPRVPFKQSPIGINSCVDDVMRMMFGSREIGGDGVCRVGIWGSGGIGKTTLAKAIFNRAFSHFQSSSFMEGVKDKELCSLQAKLISDLSKDRKVVSVNTVDDGLSMIQRKFKNKKVFIVLDDVDGTKQLHALTGDPSSVHTSAQQLFGAGSRIIITTRDRRVLLEHGMKEHEIYQHKELDHSQSLALFSRIAFCGQTVPPQLEKAVEEAVGVSAGLPLALVVLGSHFHGRESREEWEEELEKLKRIPAPGVFVPLKISYDGLDLLQQSVFLDIACFFVGFKKDYPVYMWEACRYSPGNAIRVLQERSLIMVDGEGRIRMHEQIREMGLWIVQEKGDLKPWQYSRLWEKDDVLKMLRQKQKNECVEGIFLNVEEGCVDGMMDGLKTEAFKEIINLRILALKFVSFEDCNISHFPSSVRSLEWRGCHMEMLNIDNSLSRLAVLKISESIVTEIQWKKPWQTLKVLHISECWFLEIMPSLSGVPEVEILVFDGCTKLSKMDDSIGMLCKLKVFSMRHCESLEELPRDTAQLPSLKILNLQGCCKIRYLLPITRDSKLEALNLQGREALLSLPELPPNLKTLEMQECKAVESLPRLPSSLEELNLQGCEALLSLPELPPYLKTLEMQECKAVKSLPHLPSSLKELNLQGCEALLSLPELPPYLKTLEMQECKAVGSLPQLPRSLEELNLQGCEALLSLPELPPQLKTLEMQECKAVQSLPQLPSSLEELNLRECEALLSLPELPPHLKTLEMQECKAVQSLPQLPSSLEELNLRECEALLSLPELPPHLKTLEMQECKAVQSLPQLPSSLEELNLRECEALLSLPELPPHLKTLEMQECKAVWSLTQLPSSLEVLQLQGCERLRNIEGFKDSESELKQVNMEGQSIVRHKNLEFLNMRGCACLKELPNSICKLTCLRTLDLSDCKSLSALPRGFGDLASLRELFLQGCSALGTLPPLPPYLVVLDVSHCSSLRSVSDFSGLKNLSTQSILGLKQTIRSNNFQDLELPHDSPILTSDEQALEPHDVRLGSGSASHLEPNNPSPAIKGKETAQEDMRCIVTLESSDGQRFDVDVEAIKESKTISQMIDDVVLDVDSIVPLTVSGEILSLVIDYCRTHAQFPKNTNDPTYEEKLKRWDAEFVKVDQHRLFELIEAANYLDMKNLLDLTCNTVADMIKGKTPEEIRRIFIIKNEFTPEEEEEVRRENQWAFE